MLFFFELPGDEAMARTIEEENSTMNGDENGGEMNTQQHVFIFYRECN